jgi:hypothetical protein
MKAPLLFPKAISVCTAIMAPLYVLVGATGYWSRGNSVTDIIIFSLGESLQARTAAGLIFIQVGAAGAWTAEKAAMLAVVVAAS